MQNFAGMNQPTAAQSHGAVGFDFSGLEDEVIQRGKAVQSQLVVSESVSRLISPFHVSASRFAPVFAAFAAACR